MKLKFKGTIVKFLPARTYGVKNIKEIKFFCRESDETTDGSRFENFLPFTVRYTPESDKYDDTRHLAKFKEGDVVEFDFIPRGRRWSRPGSEERVIVDFCVASQITLIARPEPAQQN